MNLILNFIQRVELSLSHFPQDTLLTVAQLNLTTYIMLIDTGTLNMDIDIHGASRSDCF